MTLKADVRNYRTSQSAKASEKQKENGQKPAHSCSMRGEIACKQK
jgi:hypothetical protein